MKCDVCGKKKVKKKEKKSSLYVGKNESLKAEKKVVFIEFFSFYTFMMIT